jgi:hypothetical protein
MAAPVPSGDQKEELLRAAQAALEDQKARAATRPGREASRAMRRGLLLVSLLLFGASVYLLAARPAWFFTPPPPTEPVAIREASLRLMLVREARRVEDFRRERGSLPASLAEAGSGVTGVSYAPHPDGTFSLSAVLGRDTLRLHSTDSTAAFLGESLRTITRRTQQ